MALTKNSVETLIDLVEIKLSCIEIYDNQDARTVKALQHCRRELYDLIGGAPPAEVVRLREHAAA
ncbi:MAG TPA: hypothetical protein VGC25_08405 [Alphaproteobacteria bacterium]|jgi:hypothetical protein